MRPHPALLAKKASSSVVPYSQKYTIQSRGVWNFIRRMFVIDPDRSTGVPINSHYRLPTPGANPPQSYDDPVTLPAGDIADNPYWKRDVRRSYPQLSVLKQGDIAGLLTVGSAASPKEDVLKLGEAGNQQLVEVQQSGEERGLSAFFEENREASKAVLTSDGLPPTPPSLNPGDKYTIDENHGYSSNYPCRTFV